MAMNTITIVKAGLTSVTIGGARVEFNLTRKPILIDKGVSKRRYGDEEAQKILVDLKKQDFRITINGILESISVDSGTTDGTTSNKLVESGQNFNTTVSVHDWVLNTTDGTTAEVTAVDSDTTLSLSADIMVSGEVYKIMGDLKSNLIKLVEAGGVGSIVWRHTTVSSSGVNPWNDDMFFEKLSIVDSASETEGTDSSGIRYPKKYAVTLTMIAANTRT